jgi:drug/metabolite transporter (DMT)-like permease
MTTGYWYMLAGLLCFAGMGVTHKMGDRWKGNALNIALVAMIAACAVTLIRATIASPTWFLSFPYRIVVLAIPFGIAAAVALWLFQKGLRLGHIVTSWLLINLSTAIPTILSILIYHEPLSIRKLFTLVLIVASLLLLWWDRRSSSQRQIAVPAAAPMEGQ